MASTPTLTEFLLARIAENEAVVAEFTERHGALPGWTPHLTVDTEYASIFIQPERVLAECEAKRRIVEGFDCYTTTRDAGWMVTDIFKLLALPYADHPDYQEAWRA